MSSNGLVNGYGVNGTTTNAGSRTNPYAIRDVADLNAISSSNWGNDVCYTMTANLNMSDATFTSKGTEESPFLGTFNGKRYTISNCSKPLFNYIGSKARVMNVKLDTCNVWHYNVYALACLCSYCLSSYSSIINCEAINCECENSKNQGSSGIFVGKGICTSIINCHATNCIVDGDTYAGVICGQSDPSYNHTIITNCSAIGCTSYVYSGHAGCLIGEIPTGEYYFHFGGGGVFNCFAINCTATSYYPSGIVGWKGPQCDVSFCYSYNCTLNSNSSSNKKCGICYEEIDDDIQNAGKVSNCASYNSTAYNYPISNSEKISNCYSYVDVSESLFKNKSFWDGTASNTLYLSYDFNNTWTWDNTYSLPILSHGSDKLATRVYVKVNGTWK